MKDTLAVINFRETSSEWIMRCFPEVAVLVLFICFSSTHGWRRRRRRRCAVRNCAVSSWSSWSSCTANQCLQGGSQRRTRWQVTAPLCGGLECPSMEETRQCYGTRSVNCQLSSWSEWSSCSTPCGVSGIQTSSRHRIITEQCGGTCSTTFRKTRSCPEQSCLNGGSLHSSGTCFCNEGFSGDCCQKKLQEGKLKTEEYLIHTLYSRITKLLLNSEHNHSSSSVFPRGWISHCDIQGFEKLKKLFLRLIFSIQSLMPCLFLV